MNYWWIIYMDRQGINLTSASAVKRPLCHVIIIADWTDSQSSYELMRALDWEINGGFICSTVDVIQAKFLKYHNGQFGSCVPVISELLWDMICECDHICACMCVFNIRMSKTWLHLQIDHDFNLYVQTAIFYNKERLNPILLSLPSC